MAQRGGSVSTRRRNSDGAKARSWKRTSSIVPPHAQFALGLPPMHQGTEGASE